MQLSPQAQTALNRLNEAGFEAFLVGGAVRDYARGGAVPKDYDIATNALPRQVEAVFSGYRLIATGRRHGTITVVMDGAPLEITTYRVDGVYSDHRRPDEVRFTRSLRADLERRDFTINALAYHPALGVIDPLGGLDDLRAGLLRCVGDPARRFREDGLRILRGLRFAAVLSLEAEPGTAAALHESRGLLAHIAAQRIREELTGLLCGASAAAVLSVYGDVAAAVIPELAPLFGLRQHNPRHDRDAWAHTLATVAASPAEPVLRWAALLHDVGKPACFSMDEQGVGHFFGHGARGAALADGILRRLCFDNASREQITTLIRCHELPLAAEAKPLRKLLSRLGPDTLLRLIELRRADICGQSPLYRERLEAYPRLRALAAELQAEKGCLSLRELAVNGRDLLALGLSGRAVGAALEACLAAVLEERIPNEREALLDFAGGWH